MKYSEEEACKPVALNRSRLNPDADLPYGLRKQVKASKKAPWFITTTWQ